MVEWTEASLRPIKIKPCRIVKPFLTPVSNRVPLAQLDASARHCFGARLRQLRS